MKDLKLIIIIAYALVKSRLDSNASVGKQIDGRNEKGDQHVGILTKCLFDFEKFKKDFRKIKTRTQSIFHP